MKRIVIPVYKDKLCVHFEQCTHYEIFEINNGNITKKKVRNVNDTAAWLIAIGTTDIIAYNIDNKLIKELSGSKINLFVGIPVSTTKTIIESYLSGNLKSNTQIIKGLSGNKVYNLKVVILFFFDLKKLRIASYLKRFSKKKKGERTSLNVKVISLHALSRKKRH